MILNEALLKRSLDVVPSGREDWASYISFQRVSRWADFAIIILLLLTVFETPLWCKVGFWEANRSEHCAKSIGLDTAEIIMSNVPLLPAGAGLIVECVCLGIVLWKVWDMGKVHNAFKKNNSNYVSDGTISFQRGVTFVYIMDVAIYCINPTNNIRIAPLVRFLLVTSHPAIGNLLYSYFKILIEISKSGIFLLGTVVVFAWITAMVFDDMTQLDQYGTPLDKGFENFGNAIYTSFGAMTTSNLPDVLVPSYSYNRWFIAMWLPFFMIAVCIFRQVMLATVYHVYQEQVKEEMRESLKRRKRGINKVFNTLKEQQWSEAHGEYHEVVRFQNLEETAKTLQTFTTAVTVDLKYLEMVFQALDDDANGVLTREEFDDMCDVLQYSFVTTRRDSWLRRYYDGTKIETLLQRIMENGAEGPDYGYSCRFAGSHFDMFMNIILAMNVLWIMVQSVYDLNDIPAPYIFSFVDTFFILMYVLEALFKLAWWSGPELWTNGDFRFDTVTTVILAIAGLAFAFFSLSKDIVRYLNMLRLVRLLKALQNIDQFATICSVISKMVTTCLDVLFVNVLVIYLWSAVGVQLYGGKLYESNPAFEGKSLDYFGNHYEVYNFNDVPLGMISLFFFTLGSWVDPVAQACMALHKDFTLSWFASAVFLFGFYVFSPLLAFNVFTAFSIDVFCKLQEFAAAEKAGNKTEVEMNLDKIRREMAEKGMILHIRESADLAKAKVYRSMFVDEGEDEEQ